VEEREIGALIGPSFCYCKSRQACKGSDMIRSATDVMQDVIFSAVLDAVMALKDASKGLPNTLLRDLNTLHANTSFNDLPPEMQRAIGNSVRAAFTRLLKEGYSVSPGKPEPNPAVRRNSGPAGGPRPSGGPHARSGDKRGGPRPPSDRAPSDRGRPPRNPRPPSK
jgi:hypothetical protein